MKVDLSGDDQLAIIRRTSNISSYGIIKGIMGSGVVDSLPLRVRCECVVPSCEEIIELKLGQRRELRRSYPRGFIIVPDHANVSLDRVVHSAAGFSVVEMDQFAQAVTDL